MKASSWRARRVRVPLELVLPLAATLALVSPAATSAGNPPGCSAVDPLSNSAAACGSEAEPVPSLDPRWSASFVPPPVPKVRAAAALCLPVDAVFYAQTDWLRLAQKLRSNPSACANYYVSVPPLTSDKTALRANQAPPIRALGPQMHAMAEINVGGWSSWVTADSTRTWFDAGVEARRRMAAAGFDVSAGDIWAVNEFSSAVRIGTGNARQNMRDLVRGLYAGDGTAPVRGLIWVSGISQPTTNLGPYKTNLKLWLGDGAFWDDMSQYVQYFSQEVYGSITNWAVPGTTVQERLGPLVDYVGQAAILAAHAPADLSAMAAYLGQADTPTANAAWPRPVYGWPPAANTPPYTAVQADVSAQVYALRHYQGSRASQSWGFAWNPQNFVAPDPPIADFTNQTAAILDRLAAAIHASDTPTDDPGLGACGTDLSWCLADLDGSSFNPTWHIFNTWTQPDAYDSSTTVQENTPVEIALNAKDDDGDPLTYSIVDQPRNGTLTGTGATVTYTPAPDYAGPDSFTFKVSDGVMDSRVATVSITVNAPPTVTLDSAGPIDEGAPPIALTVHASDVDGDPVSLTWSTPDGTASFAADDGPATETVTVTADDGRGGSAKASIDIEVRNVPPTADAGPLVTGAWGTPVTLAGSATDPSVADQAKLSASWDFGDGSTGEGFNVAHAYADPGTYTATLTVHDKDGAVGADTTTVAVGPRPAGLAYTAATVLDAASALVAVRLGDTADTASARLEGHPVTIAIGSSTCTSTTDTQGLASCTLPAGSLSLGPANVTATFSGDTLYSVASTQTPVLLYRLPAGGAFAVGDRSASGPVTFWSRTWWRDNTLSGGPAPSSFKGFVHPNANTWIASPGFGHAPSEVPEWMGLIVTTTVVRNASVITGDTSRLVVVHVDEYDPARTGHGTVVASLN